MNDCSDSDLRHSIRADHPEQQTLDQVILFQAADGQVSLDVRLEADTVWLSQAQMAELFGRERSEITRHVGNVFREGELAEPSNVHFLHIAGAHRPVGFYSLDVIISVGYRVKSPRVIQFRIWATQVLRQHLIQGYTLHQRRLQERGLGELEQALGLMARTLSSHGLVSDEGQAVLEVVQRYSRAWRWLLAYHEDRLPPITAEPDGSPEVRGWQRRSGPSKRFGLISPAAARPPRCSARTTARPSPASSGPSSRPSMASRSIPTPSCGLPTCSIS